MKGMKVLIVLITFIFLTGFPTRLFASDSLSYSGRLVNTNGSPVTGPVDLRLELAYTNALGAILCSEDITNIGLTHGVFHVKYSPTCTSTTLNAVLAATPANESVAIRVTDITVPATPKAYPFQALHSMPFSLMSHMSKQLAQLGATNGQVLAWNNTTKQWEPTNAGAGSGTVTSITAGTGLDGGTITNTGTISIADSGVNTLQLAANAVTGAKILDGTIENADVSATAGIARSKLAIGTPNYVLINDGTGAMSAVAQLPISQGGTGASTAAGARTNLGLGAAAERGVTGTGNLVSIDTIPTCQSFEKLYFLAGIWYCNTDNDSADATKLPLAGGTMTGAIDMNGNRVLDLPTPTDNAEAATKLYVDTAISGVGGSQWTTSGSNIYYNVANGNVGIGTTSPSQKLAINNSSSATSGALFNIYSTLSLSPSANGSVLGAGIYASVTKNVSFAADRLYGGLFSATNSSGTANTLYGVYGTADGRGTNLYGGFFKVAPQGTVANAVGLEASTSTDSSAISTFTEVVGVRSRVSATQANTTTTLAKALDLSVDHSGGVVTNAYGIYIGTIGGASTGTRWGIYSSDSNAKSYFAGNLGLGAISPSSKLHVVGDTIIEGKVRLKSDNTNYVELKAPASLAGTIVFNLPGTLGTSGQALVTDGSGNLSWSTISAGATSLGGDLSGTVSSATIVNGAITSSKILDGTIVNADINASASIDRSKLASGTPNYVLINDASGVMSEVAQLPITQGGTGASTAAGARTNLGLGAAAERGVTGTGNLVSIDTIPTCQSFEKLYFLAGIWYCNTDSDTDVTKLPLAGGTMAGAIDMNGNRILDLPTPIDNAEAATKLYVDNLVGGITSSQWITSGSNIYRNTGYVGIGTTAPAHNLTVSGETGSQTAAVITYSSAAVTDQTSLLMQRARGTEAVPSAVQNGDYLGQVKIRGYDGSSWKNAFKMIAKADGTISSGVIPGRVDFYVTDSTGSENVAMTIKSDGSVGVGASSPSVSLQVGDSTATTDQRIKIMSQSDAVLELIADSDNVNEDDNPHIFLSQDGLSSTQYVIGITGLAGSDPRGNTTTGTTSNALYFGPATSTSGSNIQFATDNAVRMTILSSSGNVGIGANDPSSPLEIRGTHNGTSATLLKLGTTGSNMNTSTGLQFMEGTGLAVAGIRSVDEGSGAVSMRFDTYNSAYNPDSMVITGGGNVGIGITNPLTRLHVVTSSVSAAYLAGNNINSTNLVLSNTSTGGRIWSIGTSGSAGSAAPTGSFSFYDNTAGSTRMAISPTGNVGIGIASPGYKLDVSGDINSSTALRVGGTQICTSTGCTASSDRRFKKDIKPLEHAYEKILMLQGVEYDWKDSKKFNDKHQVGFIAQDLEKVYPEVVTTDKETGYKSVSYDKLVAPMVEAFKELASRFGLMNNDVSKLKREMASVKEENEKIKAESQKLKDENAAIKSYLCQKDPKASICK